MTHSQNKKDITFRLVSYTIVLILLIAVLSSTSYAALNDGIVVYYKFNEGTGTAANDNYGRYNATVTSPYWNGTSLDFSTGSKVTTPLFPAGSVKTIQFWGAPYIDNWGAGQYWLRCNNGSEYYGQTNKLYLTQSGGGSASVTSAIGIVPAGTFVHYVVTINGTNSTVWINGTQLVMSPAAYTYSNISGAGDCVVTLGNYDSGALPFRGKMKEVAMWNRVLSSSEIASLYNGGTPVDLSNSSNLSPGGLTSDGFCYQEFANQAVSCGGLATGNYNYTGTFDISPFQATKFYDGNYSTYSNVVGFPSTYTINYTIPPNVDSINWQILMGPAPSTPVAFYHNLTIPQSCYAGLSTLSMYINITSIFTQQEEIFCYNRTGQYQSLLVVGPSSYLGEEAVFWHFASLFNVTLYNASSGGIASAYNITVTFQNATNSFSNSTQNGTILNMGNIYPGTQYTVTVNSSQFVNTTFVYTRGLNDSNTSFYLVPTGTLNSVTFDVISTDNKPITNSLVVVEKFVNGSYQSVFSRLTDINGQATFFFIPGIINYRITASATGYVTRQFQSDLLITPQIIPLDTFTRYSIDQSSSISGVSFTYSPRTLNVTPGLVTFSITTTPLTSTANVTLTRVYVYNSSGSILNTSTIFTNGTANVTVNLSAYNGSMIWATFVYGGNSTTYSFTNTYQVTNTVFTGSIEQARQYMLGVNVQDRIFLWVFVLMCLAIISYAGGIRGIANAGVTAFAGYGLGYVFALNMFVLSIVLVVVILTIVAVGS